jgi:hypothetical protein
MRIPIRVWSGLVIICGLCIGVFTLLLLPHAPRLSRPITSLHIGQAPHTVTLPGRLLTCADQPPLGIIADCLTQFEGQPLHIALHGSSTTLTSCTARYNTTLVPCSASYIYAPDPAPAIIIADTLGLDAARFNALRQDDMLTHLTEAQWLRIMLSMSLLVVGVGQVVAWHAARPQTTRMRLNLIGGGLLAAGVVFLTLQFSLLRLGFID